MANPDTGTLTGADLPGFGGTAESDAPPRGGRAAGAHRRRVWPWLVLAALVVVVASVVAGTLVLGAALGQLPGPALGSLDIHIDGERLLSIPRSEAAWWAVGAAVLAALLIIVIVPLVVLLALLLTALAMGAAAVVTLVVAAVALSPLWAVALLLWLVLRRRGTGAPRAAAGAAQA